jgi:hypothetical protein
MDLTSVKKIMQLGEGETVEFKSSFGKEAIETLAS